MSVPQPGSVLRQRRTRGRRTNENTKAIQPQGGSAQSPRQNFARPSGRAGERRRGPIAISPLLAVLAIVQIGAVGAIASPDFEELIDTPDLEFLGWNDGIMSGLLADRNSGRDTPDNAVVLALDLYHDGLVLDRQNSAEAASNALVDLMWIGVFEDSAADLSRTETPARDDDVECWVWGDTSIPCESP